MATYLQGVTDYIPQYQPFQPDLNFYGNVLQTKQTQYDTNWKSLNKMYNQYYNADLTRDNNIAKKDNYLNQIEFNLQRVSQLDLSLEQNVDQATQVFKPFYEDKGLMKDMAFTKNYMREVSFGESLKNAYDQKDRDKYWNDGIAELNFRREEFKESSESDAMSFQSPVYTPYVNTVAKAQEVAKEAGLSVESVDFSKDGKWIIKTTNGEALTEPLKHLFEARLGNDPGIQDVYRTQSYVNRKTYAQSNAAQFGGDKNAAEMKYLEDSFNILKAQSKMRYEALKGQSVAYESKIQNIQKQVDEGDASPEAKMYLSQYMMNKEINDQVLARAETEQNELSTGQNTATTTTGFINPYGDIKSLRFKVDNGMASTLMQKDLNEAAQIFAFKNAKQDMEANPYAVLSEKHKYSMQEVAARNAGLERVTKLKIAADKEKMINEHRLKIGTYYLDEETGDVVPVAALNQMFAENEKAGSSTDKYNMKEASKYINELNAADNAQPYLLNTVALIEKLVSTNQMSSKEASTILGYSKNPNISYQMFNTKLNKYGTNWLRKEVGHKDLAKIQNKMDSWLGQNGALNGVTGDDYENYQRASVKFEDYTNYLKADADWRKKSSYEVEKELRRTHPEFKYVDFLYDNKGELRSEEEFYKVISKEKGGSEFGQSVSKYNAAQKAVEKAFEKSPNPTPYMMPFLNLMDKKRSTNYEDMVAAAGRIYSSGKVKSPVVGLSKLSKEGGSGLFTKGTTNTWVNPKAHGAPSSIWSGEVFRDLSNLDLFAYDKTRVSFDGFDKKAWTGSEKTNNGSLGKALFDAIKSEMLDNKSKMGEFKLGIAPIANDNFNKAAVIIHPDAAWLKGLVKSGEKSTGPGLITAEQYDRIIKNGISVITDSKNMTNSMYKASFQSPLASYIDYMGSYEYVDPVNPNYKMHIKPNKIGTGDYTISTGFPLWNPEENKYVYTKALENLTNYGMNLEGARAMKINEFEEYKIHNKNLYNGRY